MLIFICTIIFSVFYCARIRKSKKEKWDIFRLVRDVDRKSKNDGSMKVLPRARLRQPYLHYSGAKRRNSCPRDRSFSKCGVQYFSYIFPTFFVGTSSRRNIASAKTQAQIQSRLAVIQRAFHTHRVNMADELISSFPLFTSVF